MYKSGIGSDFETLNQLCKVYRCWSIIPNVKRYKRDIEVIRVFVKESGERLSKGGDKRLLMLSHRRNKYALKQAIEKYESLHRELKGAWESINFDYLSHSSVDNASVVKVREEIQGL